MVFAVVGIIRLLTPLYILKRPFWGMVLAILADAIDMELIKFLGSVFESGFVIDFGTYRWFDISFDFYLATLALYRALVWEEALVRRTFVLLFLVRMAGWLLFLMTAIREILFWFPNLFEFFFLFYAFMRNYYPDFRVLTVARLFVILLFLLIPKLAEEYVLHIQEGRPWAHFKHDVLGWPKTPAD